MIQLEILDLDKKGDFLRVTLNREDKANVVNLQMTKELIQLADWLREEDEIKYVVFTNKGKFFSAGADLFEMENDLGKENRSGYLRKTQIIGQEMVRKLENLEQITIAAVKGSAYGAGAVLPITADFRFMTETSVFNMPETNVGLFLTWGCTPRLVKAVGAVKAKEIIMLGENVSAEECYRSGLINKIVSAEEMDKEVEKLIAKIRSKGQHGIRMTKKLVNASVVPNFGDITMSEPELVERVVESGEPEEKVERFTGRRE